VTNVWTPKVQKKVHPVAILLASFGGLCTAVALCLLGVVAVRSANAADEPKPKQAEPAVAAAPAEAPRTQDTVALAAAPKVSAAVDEAPAQAKTRSAKGKRGKHSARVAKRGSKKGDRGAMAMLAAGPAPAKAAKKSSKMDDDLLSLIK
jgi:hypothetical protein